MYKYIYLHMYVNINPNTFILYCTMCNANCQRPFNLITWKIFKRTPRRRLRPGEVKEVFHSDAFLSCRLGLQPRVQNVHILYLAVSMTWCAKAWIEDDKSHFTWGYMDGNKTPEVGINPNVCGYIYNTIYHHISSLTLTALPSTLWHDENYFMLLAV